MASYEVAMRDHLSALGLVDGGTKAPTWYVGVMKNDPDFAVAVIPDIGPAPFKTLGEFPAVTIRVRHANAGEANDFMRLIFLQLQEFSTTDLGGSGIGVGRVTATQGVVQFGRDQDGRNGRWVVQQTFGAIVPRF